MAYKDGFVIEYVEKRPTKLSCRVCVYIGADKSCSCRGVHIPSVGYDNWKYCDDFRLSSEYEDCEVLQRRFESLQAKRDRTPKKGKGRWEPSSGNSGAWRLAAERVRNNPVTPGTRVSHLHYGKGNVVRLTDDTVSVQFTDKLISFPYPTSVARGDIAVSSTQPPGKDHRERIGADLRGTIVFHEAHGLGNVYTQEGSFIVVNFPWDDVDMHLDKGDFALEDALTYAPGFTKLKPKRRKRLKEAMLDAWQRGEWGPHSLRGLISAH